MKPATIKDIKSALSTLSHEELTIICVKMAAFDKGNKELLTYLLFEADDQAMFIKNVKEEMDHQFAQASSNIYFAKKTYRKILRIVNNYIRFSKTKTTEVELLIYFCKCLSDSVGSVNHHPVISNMYERQLVKIEKALSTLHEDLQYDYGQALEELREAGNQ